MDFAKLDAALAGKVGAAADVPLMVTVRTGTDLSESELSKLAEFGITPGREGQFIFGSELDMSSIGALSELPCVKSIRLAQYLEPKGH